MEPVLDETQSPLVALVGAQPGQVLGQPAYRRGVGATVVVDYDHDPQVGLRRYVVQRLPGHAPRQRSVPDHHDHGAFLSAQAKSLGEAFGPGQGRRSVCGACYSTCKFSAIDRV